MKKFSKILMAAVLGMFLVAGSSWATPTLKVFGGTTTITVSDGSALDTAAAAGIVDWSGVVDNFIFAGTTGVTKDQLGTAVVPEMHFDGHATTGATGGTVVMSFSEVDFGPLDSAVGGFLSSMSGLGDGVQSLDVYYDTGNTIFGMGTQIAAMGPHSGGLIGDTTFYNGILPAGNFSLTMVATIILGAGETASFDDGVSAPVPEPATMLLLGVGLIGLAGASRKKIFKA